MKRIATHTAPARPSYDVVIIGGAIMGASVAYWLTQDPAFDGSILVIERDSTFERASTALATSAIRQQFSNPVNVLMSQFGVEVIRSFPRRMAPYFDAGQAPDLAFKERGFLYMWPPEEVEGARARVDMQRSLGAHTIFLSPGEIRARFPFVAVESLGGASWATQAEGWFDNLGLLDGFRRAAGARGAELLSNEVVAIDRDGASVTGVHLATGERVACGTIVNASGPRGGITARMAGLDIPVEPRKRHSFVFACASTLPGDTPHMIDITGTFCRPEGQFYLAGSAPEVDGPAEHDDFDTVFEEFEERVWPALAERVPAFEAIKLQRSWTGHYEFNTVDQNAIIGPHDEVKNFIFINGFSGHGLQHAAAAGRGVSEIIGHGRFTTLDMTELGYERIRSNRPFLEAAVI